VKLYAVSIAYMMPETIASSVARFFETAGEAPLKWILVDNHWPMYGQPDKTKSTYPVYSLARLMNADRVTPEKNLGGHGGLSFGLKALDFADDDLILNYDLDSWPVTQGWLSAMIEVMEADSSLGFVALLDNRCESGKDWKFETIGGHKVAFLNHPDMWNVTLFRGKMLRDGMVADSKYYGFVETAMARRLQEKELRMGRMYDFREDPHPIPHPHHYHHYKREHAEGHFPGSFEEYLKEKQVKP
jgi:hypothetical protein